MTKKLCPLPIRKGQLCDGTCPFRIMFHDRQRGLKYLSCSYTHKQISDENGETVEFVVSIPSDVPSNEKPRGSDA